MGRGELKTMKRDEESCAQFVRDSDPWLWNNVVEDLTSTVGTLDKLTRMACRTISMMNKEEKRALRESLDWSLLYDRKIHPGIH